MKTDLFFYTGTGNSLWTARSLAKELGDAEVIPITRCSGAPVVSRAEAIGIIFPVHIWGLPPRVIAFADAIAKDPARYHFAVAVNAGQVAATLLQLNKRMQARGLSLSSGFELAMPNNYILWGGPGPEAGQIRRIEAARDKIGRIAAAVAARESGRSRRAPCGRISFLPGSTGSPFPAFRRWTRDSGLMRNATPAASARPSAPVETSTCRQTDLSGVITANSALPASSGVRRRRSSSAKRRPGISVTTIRK